MFNSKHLPENLNGSGSGSRALLTDLGFKGIVGIMIVRREFTEVLYQMEN